MTQWNVRRGRVFHGGKFRGRGDGGGRRTPGIGGANGRCEVAEERRGWRARKGPGESRVRREVDGMDGIRGSEGSRRGGGGSEGEVNGPEWTQVGGNSDGSTSWWPHQDLEDLGENNFKQIETI